MIHYDAYSSVTSLDSQATKQHYVFVSPVYDFTEVAQWNNDLDLTQVVPATAESLVGGNVMCRPPVSPTVNLQVFADSEWLEFAAKDDVRNTKDLIYSWEKGGNGRLASFYVVYFVEQNFRSRAYDQVNRLLAEVNPSLLTEWSMIALLRSSFSARFFLPAWSRLLFVVRERLDSQGKDSDRLLRGLSS